MCIGPRLSANHIMRRTLHGCCHHRYVLLWDIYACLSMFYLYFSLFNKNFHKVKNIAIRIVSCHTYRDTYRIVKMCIVTSLVQNKVDMNPCTKSLYQPAELKSTLLLACIVLKGFKYHSFFIFVMLLYFLVKTLHFE